MYTFAKWYAAFRLITWQFISHTKKSSCLIVLRLTLSTLLLEGYMELSHEIYVMSYYFGMHVTVAILLLTHTQ